MVGIPAPERVRVDRERRLREVEHVRQDRVEVERAEKPPRRLDQHPEPRDLLRLSGEELVDRGPHDLLGHGETVVRGGKIAQGRPGGRPRAAHSYWSAASTFSRARAARRQDRREHARADRDEREDGERHERQARTSTP